MNPAPDPSEPAGVITPARSRFMDLWDNTSDAMGGWYTSVRFSNTYSADYATCLADAAKGVPRAQKYIAKYTELRMTT